MSQQIMGYSRMDENPPSKLKKYIKLWPILVIALFLLTFAKNIPTIIQARKRIEIQRQKVENQVKENQELKNKLEIESGEEYVEKQLRDKLGLAKEGEIILVLPDKEVLKKLAPAEPVENDVIFEPNWKKWLNLFI